MERAPPTSRPEAPRPHLAHAIPARPGCLSGGIGGKSSPANFADLGTFCTGMLQRLMRGVESHGLFCMIILKVLFLSVRDLQYASMIGFSRSPAIIASNPALSLLRAGMRKAALNEASVTYAMHSSPPASLRGGFHNYLWLC